MIPPPPTSTLFPTRRSSDLPEIGTNQNIVEELPEEPIFAEADEGQLKQVFWNLARNALQAMPQGGTLRATLDRNSHQRLRSEEHTSELQSQSNLVCRLLLEK